jgi:uncharacterized protein (TIGR02147 family)
MSLRAVPPSEKRPELRPEDILTSAAEALKKQWSGMSLRAVAGKLEISPSYWSKILRGKKPLPQNLLEKVVKVLAMDAQQVALLQRSILNQLESDVLAPATGIKTSRESGRSPIENYRSLGREDFWLLDEWYYIPIFNLYTMTGFDGQPESMAAVLGLRLNQVEEALRRFVNYGFLKMNERGELVRTELQLRFPTDRSFTHVRKYHQAALSKAKEELAREGASESFENRLISAVCFAGSSEKIKEARLILEEAMYRAANIMANETVRDEVYQLNLQLYPLTKTTIKTDIGKTGTSKKS